MTMPYGFLADMVLVMHLGWIFFLILGGIWGRRIRAVRLVHIPALVFAFIINLFGWACPLTYVEVWLRRLQSPGAAYEGSFISHYVERMIYLPVPQWALFALTLALCLFNAWLYLVPGRKRTSP